MLPLSYVTVYELTVFWTKETKVQVVA
ncbi:uncharacterized protein METZ01_LOCUS234574 [marine metagenome]|uniref:Uncharacterized protein n=1 Tax=marine metagenome TaxID=408172 RepID=A0A382H374_9ZZZZ